MTHSPNLSSPDKNSGSPDDGGPEFLVVGKLRRPHGLRGDMIMTVWTDFPERLEPGFELFVGDNHKSLIIKSVRWHGQNMLIDFEGYIDREQVGVFRNQTVSVRTDDIPALEDGEYYIHELIGLRVVHNEDDVFLGTVNKIIETGAANDVFLVVADDGKELLLPDIESVIEEIDIEKNEMRVNLIKGLLPDD